MRIGIDFDNTIVGYDRLFQEQAIACGYPVPPGLITKQQIRDEVRQRYGDEAWQRMQGAAYGPQMHRAELIDGVVEFCRRCTKVGAELSIVSHKTKTATFDDTGTELREAAMSWLASHGFFDDTSLGLSRQQIYFESTREKKIRRIVSLGLSHFVDDLMEVLTAPDLPASLKKILYAPAGGGGRREILICRTWAEITKTVFGG